METTTNKEQTVEIYTLTSDCTCTDYNEDTHEETQSEYCYESEGWELELLEETIENNFKDYNFFDILYTGVGWTQQIGEAWTRKEHIVLGLQINGDYRVEVEVHDDKILATRYSHDEPTGAKYIFYPTHTNYDEEENE